VLISHRRISNGTAVFFQADTFSPENWLICTRSMSLFIASLNSGSNGNCYYVGDHQNAVLIDVGISCRETERRMKRIGLSMDRVRAIFVSHEHSDHIRGLAVLSAKYQLPVYITTATQTHGRLILGGRERLFRADQPVSIGDLSVTAFVKCHDAADPHSFIVEAHGLTIGIFTDIGEPCERLIRHFSGCHAAFLEANYDEDLLRNGRYPYFLKRRISGGKGHLSNRQALELFRLYRPAHMTHLLLSHLSRDNNDPVLVADLFAEHANGVEVVIASRDQETAVFAIGESESVYESKPITQYSLF
jgi:phosphoribosyl 1,2-cyclic phosphodiesterase